MRILKRSFIGGSRIGGAGRQEGTEFHQMFPTSRGRGASLGLDLEIGKDSGQGCGGDNHGERCDKELVSLHRRGPGAERDSSHRLPLLQGMGGCGRSGRRGIGQRRRNGSGNGGRPSRRGSQGKRLGSQGDVPGTGGIKVGELASGRFFLRLLGDEREVKGLHSRVGELIGAVKFVTRGIAPPSIGLGKYGSTHPLEIPASPDLHDEVSRITRRGMGVADNRVDVELPDGSGKGLGPSFLRKGKHLEMKSGGLDGKLLGLTEAGLSTHELPEDGIVKPRRQASRQLHLAIELGRGDIERARLHSREE